MSGTSGVCGVFKAAGGILMGLAVLAVFAPETRWVMDAVSTAAFGAFLLVWRPS